MKSLFPLCLLSVAALSSGCVSSKYKLARKDMPPPVALNLVASQPPVDAQLHSVIAYQGPGSWKRDAFWDEYVLSIVNGGDTPLVIESASLSDFQGQSNSPGDDPWKLENESKTWWQKVRSSQTGNLVALGAGAAGLTGTLLAAAIIADGGFLAPATAAGSALAGAAVVTLAAAPIYAVTVLVINSNNKQKVVAEYQRRRIALPATVPPGQTTQGSLFFRISPGPQRLALRCCAGGEPFDLAIDLAPLAGLHLKPATPGAPAAGPKTSSP